ncbi:MAG TPA: pitrilysin family protein [Gemmatimonadaceae bacterium]|nr:pitrilysin family protein [Gemmatimonadaceae bacterium]
MTNRPLVAFVYLLAACAGAPPVTTPAPAATGIQATPRISFEKYTLPNGLQVILHEDHSTPIVAVNTWYHVGSGDEQPGRTGFAHLFEHIMFMGSQNVPVGMFDQWLEAAGADNNGSTTEDRTNYYEVLPANALELALWLDADRMGWLLPTMDLPKVDLQRDVVKNERRQGVDNVPYGRADETILAALYPKGHPYSWPVIGSMADLSAATLEDTRNFFRTYYAPNNATLAIAGDFDPATAKRLVEKYFGPIPRGPAVNRRTSVPPVVIPNDKFLVLEDRVQLPRLFYTWPTVKLFAPDDAALDILAQVLANDKNSRLYKKLVYDLQVAQSVRAFQESSRLTGKFQVDVLPKPGQAPADIDNLVQAEIAGIINNGISQRELVRAQNSYRAQFLDRIASVLGKADVLNSYNYFAGTPDYVQQDAARYDRVTVADVQRVARTYLGKPKVVLTVVPEGKKELMLSTAGGAQ